MNVNAKCEVPLFIYDHTKGNGKCIKWMIWIIVGHSRSFDRVHKTLYLHIMQTASTVSLSKYSELFVES